MFAVFLLGFALLALLSGAFSYLLILPDIFLIAALSFVFYYFVIGKPRVLFWSMIVTILAAIASGIYLYRHELLYTTLDGIIAFLKPYYYSISIEEFYIGRLHQQLMLFIIGLALYWVIVMFYQSKSLKIIPPILGMFIVVPAYLSGLFSSIKDRNAFFVFFLALVVYYFEVYYIRLSKSEGLKGPTPFYVLSGLMAVMILVIAIFANNMIYNPFKEKPHVGTGNGKATQGASLTESDFETPELVYKISDEFVVQDKFAHQGITLFKVKTDKLKYYKSQTYNVFKDGRWENTLANPSEDDYPVTPALVQGLQLQDDIFHVEEVEVVYNALYSDSIVTAPFTQSVDLEDESISTQIHEDGMMVSDEMLGRDFTYSMTVAVPKYRTRALMNYLASRGNDYSQVSKYLDMPDGYEDLVALTNDITSGLKTNLDKAEAIETYLKTEFTYNEDPGFQSDDMIHEFLFDKHEGFCQQFATSMVLMLRSQGLGAGFVSGFVMGADQFELDDIDVEEFYMNGYEDLYKFVYDSDAHTWVEVFIPEFGWIQYEPTPGQSVVQFSDPIDYTSRDTIENDKPQGLSPGERQVVGLSAGALVLLAVMVLIIVFILRGRRLKSNLKRRLMVNYKVLLMYLEAAFEGKENHETLREYSRRVDRSIKDLDYHMKDFVYMLEEAFYNEVVPEEDKISELETFVKLIKQRAKIIVVPLRFRRLRFQEILTRYR